MNAKWARGARSVPKGLMQSAGKGPAAVRALAFTAVGITGDVPAGLEQAVGTGLGVQRQDSIQRLYSNPSRAAPEASSRSGNKRFGDGILAPIH